MLPKFFKEKLSLNKNEIYFLLSVFIFIFTFLAFTFYYPNHNINRHSVRVEIKKGESFNSIVEKLYTKGVIPNKFNIKIAAFLVGVDKNIKAGSYRIPESVSYIKLLDILKKGVPEKQKLITIQEGIWQKDLAILLNRELGIDEKEFLELSHNADFIKKLNLNTKNLEGYLLPETYYFYEDSTPENIIIKLSNEMQKLFSDINNIEQMNKLNMDQNQILTMASIIEGESNKTEEFKTIAGVYYNRLKKGMRLQADPTIQYAVRNLRKKVNKIYFKDLEIDSKYNTYKYTGLPPTPINNPGKAAIYAAMYPERHDYYYFVADGTGGHVFSKNLSDHQKQVNKYRIWRDQNK